MLFQFGQDVLRTQQIILCLFQLFICLFPSCLVFYDSRGFFKYISSFLGPVAQDLINTALANDGISFLSYAGVHEQHNNILQATGTAIDMVLTFPGPVNPSGNGNLRIFHRQGTIRIVQRQGHFCKAQGFSGFGTGKDHIFHFGTTEGFDALLSQNPADCIGNIAFPTAVGPDNGGNAIVKFHINPVCKRFEPIYLQLL